MDSTNLEIDQQRLRFVRKSGRSIGDVFDELASLRITIFRDFPYLYNGSVEYEKEYLQTYLNAERSFLFAVYDGNRMVGATTCIPLLDETNEVKKPFLEADYNMSAIVYFGESILLPAYRGLGLGHRFFEERETHAARFGIYRLTCFCAVVRPDNHPLRPDNYQPHDDFWIRRGYRRELQLQSQFAWVDVGESVVTAKPMVYWLRPL